MSQEIELGGVQVPEVDWEATPESIKQAVRELVGQLNAGKEKLEQLRSASDGARGKVSLRRRLANPKGIGCATAQCPTSDCFKFLVVTKNLDRLVQIRQ